MIIYITKHHRERAREHSCFTISQSRARISWGDDSDGAGSVQVNSA